MFTPTPRRRRTRRSNDTRVSETASDAEKVSVRSSSAILISRGSLAAVPNVAAGARLESSASAFSVRYAAGPVRGLCEDAPPEYSSAASWNRPAARAKSNALAPSKKPFVLTRDTRTSSAGLSPGSTTRPAATRGLVTSSGSMVHPGAEGRVAANAARAASIPSHACEPEPGSRAAIASRASAVRAKRAGSVSGSSSRRRAAFPATYVSATLSFETRLASALLLVSAECFRSARSRAAQRSAARPKTVAGVDARNASSASATRRLATTGAPPIPVASVSYATGFVASSSRSRDAIRDA